MLEKSPSEDHLQAKALWLYAAFKSVASRVVSNGLPDKSQMLSGRWRIKAGNQRDMSESDCARLARKNPQQPEKCSDS